MTTSKIFSIRLDPRTRTLVEQMAQQDQRSISAQIRWLIWQAARERGLAPDQEHQTKREH